EELAGIFEARGILLEEIEALDELNGATSAGRGYGVAGGVASAIEECVREYYPDVDVNIEHAESLSECRKMLMLAKAGKKNGCLIEGMACPGGCVAGAGTNIAVPAAAKAVSNFKSAARKKIPDHA
ncbi:MAG: iron hydrogenase, partial [Lachnospiraceae bacterium]|nr:iron hydrogenase [Lachnospiraceae bacterium]